MRDVAADAGIEQGDQLQLRTVDVPAGEVRVLRVLMRADAMGLAVEAAVFAVRIAEKVRMERGVVQRGAEDASLVAAATGDRDAREPVVPCAARARAHVRECTRRRILGGEVRARVLDADVGNADAHADAALVVGVESQPRAGTLAGFGITFLAVAGAAVRGSRALMGSLGLLATLVALMALTRRVDWYAAAGRATAT